MYDTRSWSEANALKQRCKAGARWFFWIAGLTVVTSVLTFSGSTYVFSLSLGATRFVDGVAKGLSSDFGDGIRIAGLVVDILVAGVFALLGWFAYKLHLWAFLIGMAVFAVDTVILLMFQVWISLIFHLLVMYWIFLGYQAGRSLGKLERSPEGAMPPPPPDFSQDNAAASLTTLNLSGK